MVLLEGFYVHVYSSTQQLEPRKECSNYRIQPLHEGFNLHNTMETKGSINWSRSQPFLPQLILPKASQWLLSGIKRMGDLCPTIRPQPIAEL